MDEKIPVSRRAFMTSAGVGAAALASGVPTIPAEAADRLAAPELADISVEVNGRKHRARVDPRMTLLDWIREDLDLTGAKKGCNRGECGACTVHLDGRHVNACLVFAAQCDGREVVTIEGLAASDGALHPVQQAFIDADGFQCGFCTSGQIMSAVACIKAGQARTDADIREWMSGNLCRCSAYPQIVDAVRAAAGRAA